MKSEKNYLHGRASNKQEKKKREIFLGFLLILWTNKRERKTKKKQEIFLDFQSFSNTQKESERIKTNMDHTMKKDEHRQLEWMCEHECNVGEKYVLPKLRLLA